jgi:preprotein translocase subunit YajC
MTLVPLIVLLQAEGGRPRGSDPLSFLFPMVAIFLIFYLLLIRPQQKRQREHEAMLKAIQKGDWVVTQGGLHGRVTGTTDDVLTVEIAATKGEKIRVKVDRARIEKRLERAKEGGEEE